MYCWSAHLPFMAACETFECILPGRAQASASTLFAPHHAGLQLTPYLDVTCVTAAAVNKVQATWRAHHFRNLLHLRTQLLRGRAARVIQRSWRTCEWGILLGSMVIWVILLSHFFLSFLCLVSQSLSLLGPAGSQCIWAWGLGASQPSNWRAWGRQVGGHQVGWVAWNEAGAKTGIF